MRIESPEVDPWIDRGSSQESLNLYRYDDGDPINRSDPTGLAPVPTTRPATQPTTRPSAWERAAAAVDAGDWQAATDAMIETKLNTDIGPATGKISDIDSVHLHIEVTQLAKVEFISPTYDKKVKLPAVPGIPAFPHYTGIGLEPGKHQIVGVITRVVLKSDDGRDTGVYSLSATVTDVSKRGEEVVDKVVEQPDFRHPAFKNNIAVADGGNWYIDSPLDPKTYGKITSRFFQMHIQVKDSNGKVVPGVEAWYGWSWSLDVGAEKIAWNLWPSNVGERYKDPKQHSDSPGTIPTGK